jgi:hypothetical protein
MNDPLIIKLIRYVQDTLAVSLEIEPWNGGSGLPFFLKEQYAFYQTRIVAVLCILIVVKDKQDVTPALVRKHVDLLQPKAGGAEIIYVQKQISSFNRKRLVEQKVSFIVPGNQLYLLPIGVDFREHFRRAAAQPKTLSPSAQVVILHALLKDQHGVLRLAELASQYGYSLMTMSRAFREIVSLGLAEVTTQRRKREMILKSEKRAVWEKALGYLRNPVIQRLYLDRSVAITGAICAGLSALARYSTLAESGNAVWAVSSASGRSLTRKHGKGELSASDPGCHEIEVWNYDPKLFADGGVVDRLSLFLSLRDEKDERVEAALEQMMQGMTW